MNLILFSNMPYLPAELSHKLIPNGISIFNGSSLEELNASKGLKYHYCVIDESCFTRKEIFFIVTSIKKNEMKKGKKLILLSPLNDPETIRIFTIMGFDFVIPTSLTVQSITERISAFIQKNSFSHEQRKFLRFKVNEKEHAVLNLYGEAKITDISMGGLAVNVDPNSIQVPLKTNQTYNNIPIVIENKSIFADLKLIKTNFDLPKSVQGTAIFQFTNLDEKSKNSLAEYIFYKTQENFIH